MVGRFVTPGVLIHAGLVELRLADEIRAVLDGQAGRLSTASRALQTPWSPQVPGVTANSPRLDQVLLVNNDVDDARCLGQVRGQRLLGSLEVVGVDVGGASLTIAERPQWPSTSPAGTWGATSCSAT